MPIRMNNTCILVAIIFSVSLCSFAESVHASIMKPETLPIQAGIVIDSEKDIPRLEWTAGKYLQKGRFQDVSDLCRKILAYNSDSLKAMAYLAAAYKGMDDINHFKTQSALFRKKYPESTDLYLGLAWTYSFKGEFKQAEIICRQGIKNVSSPEALMMELGGILLTQGKTEDAKIQYMQVLEKDQISTKFFLNANFALCRIELAQKDFDAVIKRAKMLIDLYAPIPQSYKFLADAYMGKNEYESAVLVYKKLMDANLKSELPYQEMALIYNDKIKNKDQALFYAREGVQKFPENPKSIDILGWIHYSRQEYSDALDQFLAAITLSDKNPWFYYHAGMAYQKMERNVNAVKNYETALDLLQDQPTEKFKKQIKKLIGQCR